LFFESVKGPDVFLQACFEEEKKIMTSGVKMKADSEKNGILFGAFI
jgi:hypothetical protein